MIKHSETILVVEDDAQIRNFITYTLKQEGFPCLTAGTAQKALTQLVSGQIDLVLLVWACRFDGMEVIKKVREWSEVPIIVVSARDQDREGVGTGQRCGRLSDKALLCHGVDGPDSGGAPSLL